MACRRRGGTYVCTIARSDDETAVQAELHVTRTTGLCSGSGNVLANVAGRADDLGLADVVVAQEDDLERITNIRIVVDDVAYLAHKVNDRLRHPVARSCLATED